MKFLKALLFSLLPLSCLAQSNFKPGYVIPLKGDTIRGFIDYKEWEKNPKDVHFKRNLNTGSPETYDIRNATEFAITGIEYYRRFILPISTDQVDINKLPTKLDTGSFVDTVFLRMSTTGSRITMYKYIDDIKPRYYLLENGETQPRELIYHAWYNPTESNTVSYSNRFRGQLANIAQKYKVNSDNLDAEILETNYNEAELVKIIKKINGPSAQQFTPQGLTGSRLFAGVGLNYSSLKFTYAQGTSYQGTSVSNVNSIYPKIVAGIDFFPNKNTQRLTIRLELSETGNQYKIVLNNSSAIPQSTSTLNFSQYNTTVSPQLIYSLVNNGPTKLYIGAGAAFNLSAYNKYQFVTQYSGSFPEDIRNNYPAFSGFWIAFPFSVGIEINKKIGINLSYIPSASLTSDNVSPSGNVSSYQLGLNYFFGK